jgi:UDPglucose 6-dehydrogenase
VAGNRELVLHLTEWPEFAAIDPGVVNGRQIIDGRNKLDPGLWRRSGWTFRAIGRGGRPTALVPRLVPDRA